MYHTLIASYRNFIEKLSKNEKILQLPLKMRVDSSKWYWRKNPFSTNVNQICNFYYDLLKSARIKTLQKVCYANYMVYYKQHSKRKQLSSFIYLLTRLKSKGDKKYWKQLWKKCMLLIFSYTFPISGSFKMIYHSTSIIIEPILSH